MRGAEGLAQDCPSCNRLHQHRHGPARPGPAPGAGGGSDEAGIRMRAGPTRPQGAGRGAEGWTRRWDGGTGRGPPSPAARGGGCALLSARGRAPGVQDERSQSWRSPGRGHAPVRVGAEGNRGLGRGNEVAASQPAGTPGPAPEGGCRAARVGAQRRRTGRPEARPGRGPLGEHGQGGPRPGVRGPGGAGRPRAAPSGSSGRAAPSGGGARGPGGAAGAAPGSGDVRRGRAARATRALKVAPGAAPGSRVGQRRARRPSGGR